MQAAGKATDATIITMGEADDLVNHTRPVHTAPHLGGQAKKTTHI